MSKNYTEYYLYYVKPDGWEDISWYSNEGDDVNALRDARKRFEELTSKNHMRLYAIYRPQNKKVLVADSLTPPQEKP